MNKKRIYLPPAENFYFTFKDYRIEGFQVFSKLWRAKIKQKTCYNFLNNNNFFIIKFMNHIKNFYNAGISVTIIMFKFKNESIETSSALDSASRFSSLGIFTPFSRRHIVDNAMFVLTESCSWVKPLLVLISLILAPISFLIFP